MTAGVDFFSLAVLYTRLVRIFVTRALIRAPEEREFLMARKIRAVVLYVLLLGLSGIVGCGGCGSKAPLGYVPYDAAAVMVVPSVKKSFDHMKKLLNNFDDGGIASTLLGQKKAEIVDQLGFDPENADSLKKIGVDPSQGLVVSVTALGEVAIVLTTADKAKFEAYLKAQLKKHLNDEISVKETTVSGVTSTVLFKPGEEAKPVAAWSVVKKHFIFCIDADKRKPAHYLAQLTKLKKTIATNKAFNKLKGKIGKHDLLFYVSAEAIKKQTAKKREEKLAKASDWMKKYIKEKQETEEKVMAYFEALVFGVELSGKSAAIRAYVAIPPEKGKAIHAVLKGVGKASDFGKFIGPDAIALARFSLNLNNLMDKVIELSPDARKGKLTKNADKIKEATKLDLKKDILGAFAGRYAFALYPPSSLGKLIKPNARPKDILSAIPAALLVQMASAEKATKLMAKLTDLAQQGGVPLQMKAEKDAKIYSIGVPGGALIEWVLVKDLLVVASGEQLAKTLKLIKSGGGNVLDKIKTTRAKGLLKKDDGILLYFSYSTVHKMLTEAELPSQLKMMLAAALGPLAKFRDMVLSMEVNDDGFLTEFAVNLN
jgi:hypothetical protein